MGDRGIIFSAPMVRALLEGRKTQTRRLIKPQPPECVTSAGVISRSGEGQTDEWSWLSGDPRDIDSIGVEDDFRTGFRPGDRLWVKEVWGDTLSDPNEAVYRADGERPDSLIPWVSPRYMPRWASRLTLLVDEVRVQRLNEITDTDAIAEGLLYREEVECADGISRAMWFGVPHAGYQAQPGAPRQAYFDLWDSIHNPRGLCPDDNPKGAIADPWVVALTFCVERANIDRLPG